MQEQAIGSEELSKIQSQSQALQSRALELKTRSETLGMQAGWDKFAEELNRVQDVFAVREDALLEGTRKNTGLMVTSLAGLIGGATAGGIAGYYGARKMEWGKTGKSVSAILAGLLGGTVLERAASWLMVKFTRKSMEKRFGEFNASAKNLLAEKVDVLGKYMDEYAQQLEGRTASPPQQPMQQPAPQQLTSAQTSSIPQAPGGMARYATAPAASKAAAAVDSKLTGPLQVG